MPQPKVNLPHCLHLGKFGEHECERFLDAPIRVLLDPIVRYLDVADGNVEEEVRPCVPSASRPPTSVAGRSTVPSRSSCLSCRAGGGHWDGEGRICLSGDRSGQGRGLAAGGRLFLIAGLSGGDAMRRCGGGASPSRITSSVRRFRILFTCRAKGINVRMLIRGRLEPTGWDGTTRSVAVFSTERLLPPGSSTAT
jgi:hypothetical protein